MNRYSQGRDTQTSSQLVCGKNIKPARHHDNPLGNWGWRIWVGDQPSFTHKKRIPPPISKSKLQWGGTEPRVQPLPTGMKASTQEAERGVSWDPVVGGHPRHCMGTAQHLQRTVERRTHSRAIQVRTRYAFWRKWDQYVKDIALFITWQKLWYRINLMSANTWIDKESVCMSVCTHVCAYMHMCVCAGMNMCVGILLWH